MESFASSIPSIFQSLHSWFTPTVFFIFLNLMIAAIVVASNLPNKNQKNHKQQEEEEEEENKNSQTEKDGPPAKLAKSPSILRRLKLPETQEALHVAATEYVFSQPLHLHHTFSDDTPTAVADVMETETTHFSFDPTREEGQELEGLDEVYSRLKGGKVNRVKSDTLPASMEVSPAKMKKSASWEEGLSSFEEEKTVEGRRPATVRERTPAAMVVEDDDVEVDSKADDFINKFKHDLKLQRTDSIIRWKSVSWGTAK